MSHQQLATDEEIAVRIAYLREKYIDPMIEGSRSGHMSAMINHLGRSVRRFNAPYIYNTAYGGRTRREDIEIGITLGYQIISSEHRWVHVLHTGKWEDNHYDPESASATGVTDLEAECYCTVAATLRAGYEIVSKNVGKPVNSIGETEGTEEYMRVRGLDKHFDVNPVTVQHGVMEILNAASRIISMGEYDNAIHFNDMQHTMFVAEFRKDLYDTSPENDSGVWRERSVQYRMAHHEAVRQVWELGLRMMGLSVPEVVDDGVISLYALWRRTFNPLAGVFLPMISGMRGYSIVDYDAPREKWITV